MSARRRVRMIPSEQTGYAPGKWVVQYRDPDMGVWFDIGDPLPHAEAKARLDAERSK